jgi:hypothetical protein
LLTDPAAPRNAPQLILAAPGIGTALRHSAGATDVDTLSWLAGRGQVDRLADRHQLAEARLRPWQRGLLRILGLDPGVYASAPLSALGDDVDPSAVREGYWLQAEPVHFAAGLDRLTYLPLTGPAAVTAAERRALMPILSEHLQDSPLRLLSGASGQWFMHSHRVLDLHVASPDAAAANELDAVMPSGKDAREVRRVMTECQMLLHDHPVNEARQRRQLPPINALWPWGGGVLPQATSRSLPAMFSDDSFVHGLYRSMSQERVGATLAAALIEQANTKRSVIAVIATDSLSSFASDWVQPLVAALRAGNIRQLDLLLDEWHIHATRGSLRRFWRKPLPASAWTT